jgi:hypothetical protein
LTEKYISPACGDIDGDGDTDIVVGGYGGLLKCFMNNGTHAKPKYNMISDSASPFFALENLKSTKHFSWPLRPYLMDWNRDGDLDLIINTDRLV